MPRHVEPQERKQSFPISLTRRQIDWIDEHPNLPINKFFRDQLDQYIEMKNKVEGITNEA